MSIVNINQFQEVTEEALVESLVQLRAKKAEVDNQIKLLEAIFKDAKKDVFSSHDHTVKTTLVVSHPVAWKALAIDLKPSEYYLKKHTSERTTHRLTVSVKKKEAA